MTHLDNTRKMIDYSPYHISSLFFIFTEDALEHYLSERELDEFYSSDFTQPEQAIYWFKKMRTIGTNYNGDYHCYKESLRFIITSETVDPSDIYLPGIDGNNQDMEQWNIEYKKFLLILWNYLFNEPFIPADLSQYRERYDKNFIDFPHMPELWREAQYEKISN